MDPTGLARRKVARYRTWKLSSKSPRSGSGLARPASPEGGNRRNANQTFCKVIAKTSSTMAQLEGLGTGQYSIAIVHFRRGWHGAAMQCTT